MTVPLKQPASFSKSHLQEQNANATAGIQMGNALPLGGRRPRVKVHVNLVCEAIPEVDAQIKSLGKVLEEAIQSKIRNSTQIAHGKQQMIQ